MPIEVAAAREEEITLGEDMMQVYTEVESELNRLRWRIHRAENKARIMDDDIDRLRYIQEELQQILML